LHLLRQPLTFSALSSPRLFLIAALLLFLANDLWLRNANGPITASLILIVLATATLLLGIFNSRRTGDPSRGAWSVTARRFFWAFVVLLLAWHVWHSSSLVRKFHPFLDVLPLQTEATRALLHGTNPYTITHPDIYDPEMSRMVYPAGSVVNGRLLVGFPYPPLCLLFDTPGELLGDIRFSHIAALALCTIFLARMATGWSDAVVIGFFVLNPHTEVMELMGWVDSLMLLPLFAAVYAAKYRRWWLPLALGLFLCSKQYAVLGLLFVPILAGSAGRSTMRLYLQSAGVAAAVTLPFALWNLPHFVQDTLLFQIRSPFRPDSLSFAVLFPIPFAVIIVVVLAAAIWALRVGRVDPALFSAGYALALLLFVATNKMAFLNYYYAVMQALLLAAVALSAAPVNPVASKQTLARLDTEPVANL
jgi:hypothetical protein